MDFTDFVESSELVEASGISNAKTLTRWAKLGLIPPPVRGKRSSGRGTSGKWPAWVVDRCVRIRQLRSQGRSLKDIADHLGCDWEQEAERHARSLETKEKTQVEPGKFAKSMKARGRSAALQNLRDTVWKQTVIELSRGRDKRKHWADLVGAELIEAVVEFIRDGIKPVLVLDDQGLSLTADFAVSECLHRCGRVSESIVVVPIADDVIDWLEDSEQISPKNWIKPVPEVSQVQRRKAIRRRLVVEEDWTFDIGRNESR